jgi:hypothetical protein
MASARGQIVVGNLFVTAKIEAELVSSVLA